jgi:hypothetical protein
MTQIDDLVRRARAATSSPVGDPERFGLVRLDGGMTHDVFVPEADASVVLKVFRGGEDGTQSRNEWDALVALAGSGIAPRPVHFAHGDRPVVVMERALGSSVRDSAMAAGHASALGGAHRRVQDFAIDRSPGIPHAGLLAARSALLRDQPDGAGAPEERAPRVVERAWSAARNWAAGGDVDALGSPDRLVFSRGDPNLSNYLWSENGLVLIDWENCGYNDPALQLADMAEHASTRALSEEFWARVADATELSPAERRRVAPGRRAMACFWRVLIERRHALGLPTTVTREGQAQRTLAVLDT